MNPSRARDSGFDRNIAQQSRLVFVHPSAQQVLLHMLRIAAYVSTLR